MKKIGIVLFLFCLTAHSQSLQRSILGSVCGTVTQGNTTLNSTLGDLVVGKSTQSNSVLVNGFLAGLTSISEEDFFITTWQVSEGDLSITIPTLNSGYNYTVDWGDGTVEFNQTGDATHPYTSAGTYTVTITGDFPRIYFNNAGDKDKILSIEQWGSNQWSSMNRAFFGCTNLVLNADDTPDLSGVTFMSFFRIFSDATNFEDLKDQMKNWNVSNVTDMFAAFAGCDVFNEDITGWQVSSVTNFHQTFVRTAVFNQDISGWTTTSATNMASMFRFSGAFDQDISGWDIGQVTTMENMFGGATAFSAENYDKLLTGWATDTSGNDNDGIDDIPSNITFGAPLTTYCSGATARATLTSEPYRWTISGDAGESCPQIVSLAISAFLSGPYNTETGLMDDTLRTNNIIPSTSPYQDNTTLDTAVFTTQGDDAIVDWVYIELRDTTQDTQNPIGDVLYSTSALLQRDGDIVALDGVSHLSIEITERDYYLVVGHRNHIPIATHVPITLNSGSTITIDLTDNANIFNGGNAVKEVESSVYGLYSGDVNGDGIINNSDYFQTVPLLGTSSYSIYDANLDGLVVNNDLFTFIAKFFGAVTQF